MIRVTHETAIGAPPDHIWALATEIERWPDWLPTMSAARKLSPGPFAPGGRFELKQPLQPAAIREVTVRTRHKRFDWRRLSRGLLTLQARHEVAQSGTPSISRLSLCCAGPISVLLWPILWVVFAPTLRMENAALKRRCETRSELETASDFALRQSNPDPSQSQ